MPKNDGIDITAITWNMGNKPPTKSVVQEFKQQLSQTGTPPSVIAISTQEELAPKGKRLQDRLLKELNKGLPKNEQYVLVKTVEPQYHSTMAGANNSSKTLMKAIFTDDNRVSSAILVKKPLKLQNPKAEIEYEPGKKKGNKSVITISGDLIHPDGRSVPLAISGGHWDSNNDKKRRSHTDKSLEAQDIKSPNDKAFSDILAEAKTVRMVMGDFNERDYLMKDGKTKDKGHLTNYQSYGFDMSSLPTQQMGTKQIHGTYGFKFDNNDPSQRQDITAPDPRSRANVAKGGFLDRIAYSTGQSIKPLNYGADLDQQHFKCSKKGKWFYHGSDHIPVLRGLRIESGANDLKVVGDYIKRRLPDTGGEIADLKSVLKNATTLADLERNVESLQYHDSTISAQDYLKQLAGVNQGDFPSLKKGLEEVIARKEAIQQKIQGLEGAIDNAVTTRDFAFLEKAFNQVTRCNELRNSATEVMSVSSENFTEAQKSQFMKVADQLIDLSYQKALANIEGKTLSAQDQGKLDQAQSQMDKMIKRFPEELASFKEAKGLTQKSLVSVTHVTHAQTKPLSSQNQTTTTEMDDFTRDLMEKLGERANTLLRSMPDRRGQSSSQRQLTASQDKENMPPTPRTSTNESETSKLGRHRKT